MDYTKKDRETLLELQVIESLAVQSTANRLSYITDKNFSDIFLYIIKDQHEIMLNIFQLMQEYNFVTKEIEEQAEIDKIKNSIKNIVKENQ